MSDLTPWEERLNAIRARTDLNDTETFLLASVEERLRLNMGYLAQLQRFTSGRPERESRRHAHVFEEWPVDGVSVANVHEHETGHYPDDDKHDGRAWWPSLEDKPAQEGTS